MNLVAIDIGGTHTRFALAQVADGRVVALDEPVTQHTADHASLQFAWQAFAQTLDRPLPRAAAIAVAASVNDEAIQLTNNPWTLRPPQLRTQLDVDALTIVNDFAAIGHAVAQLPDTDFAHLCGPPTNLPARGAITVCGPGTGLGVAQLLRTGTGAYHVIATEGGHIDFAPLDEIEDRIVRHLRARHTRVSAERVVSGPGIVPIYETLAQIEGWTIEPPDDKTIWARALAGDDPLAAAALDRFCLALGAVAGDLALAHGPTGVVIAGGLGHRLKDHLAASGFARRFVAKGRFQSLMSSIPVKLITHPQPGLYGAAAAFAQEHRP